MLERIADLIWSKIEPRLSEAYEEGYKDGERRILKAYEYGWKVGHADTMAALGAIDIHELDDDTVDDIARVLEADV